MSLVLILIIYIVLTFFWLVCFAGIMLMAYGLITTNVPFVPIPKYVVEEVKKAMPLKEGDVFYDLGSGDGRLVSGMAMAYPTAKAIGIEKAPLPYTLTLLRQLIRPLPNAKTLFKNFSQVSLSNATHVYMYLFPEVVQKLLPKFERELKPGAIIISCDFPFKTKEPTQKIIVPSGKKSQYTLYVYEF